MAPKLLAFLTALAVAALFWALPVAAQDSGYEPPAPLPTFGETEFPSDPPPTVPPGPPTEEPPPPTEEPPPTVPPGPPPPDDPGPPPDDPELAATGFGVTNGMTAASLLLLGGAGLVLAARRRRKAQG